MDKETVKQLNNLSSELNKKARKYTLNVILGSITIAVIAIILNTFSIQIILSLIGIEVTLNQSLGLSLMLMGLRFYLRS